MAAEMGGVATAPARTASSGWRRRWPEWAGYAAAAWSLGYGVLLLGLYRALGSAGFPFGASDPGAVLSAFGALRAATAAPVIMVLGVVGATVALVMARTRRRGMLRAMLLAFAWSAAVVLILVVPDYRLLATLGYLPLYLIGAPFGWPGGSVFDAITWPVANQLLCVGGGLFWAAAAVADQRRSGVASNNGDRIGAAARWTTPAAAASWGRWATAVAVIIPLLYAATRWAWALGIPLGISEELYREGRATGLWTAGAGLATVAIGGAVLTLGLVQWWGEVFPRWIPVLAGRRVPPALAIVPAALVAVAVTSAGLMFVRLTLLGTIGEAFTFIDSVDWAALAPELLWPLWGVALAAATVAYSYRRRAQDADPNGGPVRDDPS
ncbi:MAG: hypothetical protein M3464_01290 [Chloroflexota bacterium]|nr:hypothetical protein [Chloroflexota bacterium]